MLEPWEFIVCSSSVCHVEAFGPNGKVRTNYYIYPDEKTGYTIQFVCPRCGLIETWGPARRKIAKILYERTKRALS